VVASDPDVMFARGSRGGDKHCRRGSRGRTINLNLLDLDGSSLAGDNDAAGCKNGGEKVRDIQQRFENVHDLLFPSMQESV